MAGRGTRAAIGRRITLVALVSVGLLWLLPGQASARLPFKPGHYVGTTAQTCPATAAQEGACEAGTKLPISFTLTRRKISHIRAVVLAQCEGQTKSLLHEVKHPGAVKIGVQAKRAAFFVRTAEDTALGYVKGRSANGIIDSLLTVNAAGEPDPNGHDYCRGKSHWHASLASRPQRRATASSSRSSLRQRCLAAALTLPKVIHAYMVHPGHHPYEHDPHVVGAVQAEFIVAEYLDVVPPSGEPGECDEQVQRVGRANMEKTYKGKWRQVADARWRYASNKKLRFHMRRYENLHGEPEWFYWHPGERYRLILRNVVKDPDTRKTIDFSSRVVRVEIRGKDAKA